MFRKREKKIFPPGTFIATPARVCAIMQLCLAFTVLLWNIAQPFTGELFTYKAELLLYQDVMGISANAAITPEKQARLSANALRFQKLPLAQQEALILGMQGIQAKMQRSFWHKLTRALHIMAFEMPAFEQAWLLFSFLIPILLLKRVEGAAQAVWILPLLASAYALDNRLGGLTPTTSSEAELYPTEQVLVHEYLKSPLSADIFAQQAQLKAAWQLYLVQIWAHATPDSDQAVFNQQAEEGEFAFNLMRLEQRALKKNRAPISAHGFKEPLWLLAVYFFWNFYFAFTGWKLARQAALRQN